MASPPAYFAVLALLACTTQNTASKSQKAKDQEKILNCVHSVLADEELGFFDITGDSGFKLLTGYDAIVAGGRIGDGRVIAAGHSRFLKKESHSEENSDRELFMDNMWDWLHNHRGTPRTVGVVSTQNPSLISRMTWKPQYGTLSTVSANAISGTKVKVLVIDGDLHRDNANQLIDRVRNGMGLLILATNWAYRGDYNNDQNRFNNEWGPNIVARAAGIQFRCSGVKAGNGGTRNRLWSAITYQCKKSWGRNDHKK